jgi:hypothetical protein
MKCWPEIEGFLQLGNTNARTEGYKPRHQADQTRRLRVRNQENYDRRIMLHGAAHRAA